MEYFLILVSQFLAHTLNILLLKRGPEKHWQFWLINISISFFFAWVFTLVGFITVVPMYFFQLLLFYYVSNKDKDYFYLVPLGLILGIIGDYFSNVLSLAFFNQIIGNDNLNGAIPHLLVAYVTALILAWLIRHFFSRQLSILPQPVLVGATNLLLWTYYLLIFMDRMDTSSAANHKLETLFFALYSVILLAVLYNYSRTLEARYTKKTIDLQEDYIKRLEASYQQLRTFKHDYRNILYTLNAYIEEEDLVGLKQYYQKNILPTNLALEDRPVDLNPLANLEPLNLRSFLMVKLMEASTKNIKVKLAIPDKITIKNSLIVDLSEALGIILDNATEEMTANQSHEALIVQFFTDQKKITITVKNPTPTELPLHQLKVQHFTTKGADRGNGLTILDQVINRNPHLSLSTKLVEQEFTQRITIK